MTRGAQVIDLANQRFGKLVVLERDFDGHSKKRGAAWTVRCDCGTTRSIPAERLRSGGAKSCGCMRVKSLVGQTFGLLTVVSSVPSNTQARRWSCSCACGGSTEHYTATLRSGNASHCGCLRKVERSYSTQGYVYVEAPEGHPRANNKGRVLEHLLVMERMLGRPVEASETVHHKNGVRDDNRPENLELWSGNHPPGARVEDQIVWALTVLQKHAPELLRA